MPPISDHPLPEVNRCILNVIVIYLLYIKVIRWLQTVIKFSCPPMQSICLVSITWFKITCVIITGLENIHALTSIPNYEVKFVMTNFDKVTKHAMYSSFHIADASAKYRLTIYGYSGTAGRAMFVLFIFVIGYE